MNLPFILAVVLVPLITGSAVFLLVFKRVHKKYLMMFRKIILAAERNPEGIRQLVSGDRNQQNTIIKTMAGLKDINKVEIIKSNKLQSWLLITAVEKKNGLEKVFDVQLRNENQWNITRFAPAA